VIELKSAFLANISHEIQDSDEWNIWVSPTLLKEPKVIGRRADRNMWTIIEKSGARMLNTINAIIDVSQIETGDVKLSNRKCGYL
jgi:signal transduction histidine kinase